METTALQFSSADPLAWSERMSKTAMSESDRLAAASREFEAVLLRQYLGDALKPMTEAGSLFSSSNPMYGYLITDALAGGLSSAGGFGFSNVLQAQLSGGLTGKEDHEDSI